MALSKMKAFLVCSIFITISVFQFVAAKTYYVIPTSGSLCPKGGLPCFTLSQYASKTNAYFASNTSLVLLPGNHSLDSKLWINSISYLKFATKNTSMYTAVFCYQSVSGLYFEVIERVSITGLTFVGCGSNSITNVVHFTYEDCHASDQHRNGSGITLNKVFEANIVRSSFSGGGPSIVTTYGNVNIINSTFTNNTVTGSSSAGAAVFASNAVIEINGTIFRNNSAHVRGNDHYGKGGAVYAHNSPLTISNSTFIANSVTGTAGHAQGGAICAESGDITLMHSSFIKNTVTGYTGEGGAVYTRNGAINVSNTTFTNNLLFGNIGQGGAVYTCHSTVNLNNSTFVNNSVVGNDSYGGAIHSCDSKTVLNTSIFISNTVTAFGSYGISGAMSIKSYSTIYINSCTFISNSVYGGYQQSSGGAVGAQYQCNVMVVDSVFANNSVNGRDNGGYGGAAFIYAESTITIYGSTFYSNSVSGIGTNDGESGGGAIVIAYSSTEATLSNSTFTSNYVTGDSRLLGGAVLAYHLVAGYKVHNCRFTSNTITGYYGWGGAVYSGNSKVTLNSTTFTNNSLTGDDGRGGSISMEWSNIYVNECEFIHSSVIGNGGFGGALYLAYSNLTGSEVVLRYNVGATGIIFAIRSSIVFLRKTVFSNNSGSLLAFSSNITFRGNTSITNNAPFVNSSFISEEGGAVSGFQSSILFTGEVSIKYNSANDGGAIGARECKIYSYGKLTLAHNRASSSGGGIFVYQSEISFNGRTRIVENTASTSGGVHAIGSITRITGFVSISGNHAKRGGGMSLFLNAKLYNIKNNLESALDCQQISNPCKYLEFTDNFADYGGALYVSDDTNTGNCETVPVTTHLESIATLSECFFQALALHTYYDGSIYMLNTYFRNNSATIAGGSIYGGLLDRCTVSPAAELLRKYQHLTPSLRTVSAVSYILNITNLQVEDFDSSASISSDSVRVCFCRDKLPDCSFQPKPKSVKKGETFTVSLVAVDQVNNTVANSSIYSSLSLPATLGVGQSIQKTNLDGSCTELTYNVLSPRYSEQLHLYAEGPCMGIGISSASLTINIEPCPVGFKDTNLRCDCDPALRPAYVSNCSIDNDSVTRVDNVWFSFANNTVHQGYILHRHCPFDYCHPPSETVFVNLNIENSSNSLCASNRSGKLCGTCEDGLSLSLGSSRCMSCSNNWLMLVVVFALAGIALVAFILICNLTVVTGTINGLTLYANIVAANQSIFFPFDKTSILTVFIAWLNLDFGIESCFFEGLDGYGKVWLQLTFPLYVLFLVAMMIVLANKYYKFARLLFDKNPVATLATLILLSYTKFIRTIVTALSFTRLEYSDGFQETVWLLDANIPYLKGKHIPLFIVALFILVMGIAYTVLISCWQWIMRFQLIKPLKWIILKFHVNAFMDAYHAPYKKHHRYWTGLLLLVRVILYLISALNVHNNPSINLLSIICVVGSLLLLNNPSGNVYRKWTLNAIESSYIFNLVIFAAASLYIRESKGNQAALAYISTSIAFMTFLATVLYHTYTFVVKNVLTRLRNERNVIPCFAPYQNRYSTTQNEPDIGQLHQIESQSYDSFPITTTEINAVPNVDDLSLVDEPASVQERTVLQEEHGVLVKPGTENTLNIALRSSTLPLQSNIRPTIRTSACTDRNIELNDLAQNETSEPVRVQQSPSSQSISVAVSHNDDDDVWEDETTPLSCAARLDCMHV